MLVGPLKMTFLLILHGTPAMGRLGRLLMAGMSLAVGGIMVKGILMVAVGEEILAVAVRSVARRAVNTATAGE